MRSYHRTRGILTKRYASVTCPTCRTETRTEWTDENTDTPKPCEETCAECKGMEEKVPGILAWMEKVLTNHQAHVEEEARCAAMLAVMD